MEINGRLSMLEYRVRVKVLAKKIIEEELKEKEESLKKYIKSHPKFLEGFSHIMKEMVRTESYIDGMAGIFKRIVLENIHLEKELFSIYDAIKIQSNKSNKVLKKFIYKFIINDPNSSKGEIVYILLYNFLNLQEHITSEYPELGKIVNDLFGEIKATSGFAEERNGFVKQQLKSKEFSSKMQQLELEVISTPEVEKQIGIFANEVRENLTFKSEVGYLKKLFNKNSIDSNKDFLIEKLILSVPKFKNKMKDIDENIKKEYKKKYLYLYKYSEKGKKEMENRFFIQVVHLPEIREIDRALREEVANSSEFKRISDRVNAEESKAAPKLNNTLDEKYIKLLSIREFLEYELKEYGRQTLKKDLEESSRELIKVSELKLLSDDPIPGEERIKNFNPTENELRKLFYTIVSNSPSYYRVFQAICSQETLIKIEKTIFGEMLEVNSKYKKEMKSMALCIYNDLSHHIHNLSRMIDEIIESIMLPDKFREILKGIFEICKKHPEIKRDLVELLKKFEGKDKIKSDNGWEYTFDESLKNFFSDCMRNASFKKSVALIMSDIKNSLEVKEKINLLDVDSKIKRVLDLLHKDGESVELDEIITQIYIEKLNTPKYKKDIDLLKNKVSNSRALRKAVYSLKDNGIIKSLGLDGVVRVLRGEVKNYASINSKIKGLRESIFNNAEVKRDIEKLKKEVYSSSEFKCMLDESFGRCSSYYDVQKDSLLTEMIKSNPKYVFMLNKLKKDLNDNYEYKKRFKEMKREAGSNPYYWESKEFFSDLSVYYEVEKTYEMQYKMLSAVEEIEQSFTKKDADKFYEVLFYSEEFKEKMSAIKKNIMNLEKFKKKIDCIKSKVVNNNAFKDIVTSLEREVCDSLELQDKPQLVEWWLTEVCKDMVDDAFDFYYGKKMEIKDSPKKQYADSILFEYNVSQDKDVTPSSTFKKSRF